MNLVEARKAKGLTQAELGLLSGVACKTIRNIEKGAYSPTPETRDKLCPVLEVTPADIDELSAPFQRFTGYGSDVKYPRFQALLIDALHRKEMPLGRARAEAKLGGPTTIQKWIQGKAVPHQHLVRRLASVLDAPELLDAIPCHVTQITVTCPDCEETINYRAKVLGRMALASRADLIDWDNGLGNFLCATCVRREHMKDYHKKKKRNEGRKYLIEQGQHMQAVKTPEERDRALELAHAAVRGKPLSLDHIRKSIASRMTPRPKRKFGICRICGYLTESPPHVAVAAETHEKCWSQYRRDQNRFNVYPPRPFKHTSTPEYLAVSYELCVRHLLRGEAIGEYKFNGTGQGLAQEFDMHKRTIIDRIKRFLLLLPTDGRGVKILTRRAEVLLPAAKKLGYKL